MVYTHVLLLVYWAAYCILHSLLCTEWLKQKLYKWTFLTARSYRVFYNLVAIVSLALLSWFQLQVKSSLLFETGLLSVIIASILLLSGIIIMGICMKKYFREMSGLYKDAVDVLQVNGLHRIVRHPLYLGTFSFIAGIFIYWPYYKNAIVLAVIIIYTLLAIGLEEKKLLRQFGDDYQQYRETVPKIIPFFRHSKNKLNVE